MSHKIRSMKNAFKKWNPYTLEVRKTQRYMQIQCSCAMDEDLELRLTQDSFYSHYHSEKDQEKLFFYVSFLCILVGKWRNPLSTPNARLSIIFASSVPFIAHIQPIKRSCWCNLENTSRIFLVSHHL